MGLARWLVLIAALLLTSVAVWRLESGRAGLETTPLDVAGTPATVWRLPDTGPAPVVIIAHGFAGSRQLMEGFAQTLARAGYVAVTYDLLGHGRNPAPMGGDVTVIEGTTTLLMDELARVTDAALALPGVDGRAALVGHSMASDIVVRQTIRDPRVQAVVAVSMFSLAVTADQPRNLLTIAGQWEGFLAAEALRALQLADPAAELGQTAGDPAAGTGRRALLAPWSEHVGVLYSPVTLAETAAWIDATFGRTGAGALPERRGVWIMALLGAVLALGWPLAAVLGRWRAGQPPPRAARGVFLTAVALPAVAVPLILWPLPTQFLPVLVSDYLALHFLLYGLITLAVLWRAGAVRTAPGWLWLPVALFAIAGFGGAIDRYVTSFVPVLERLPILLAIVAGTVPFMLADAALTEGGRAPLWRTLLARGAALGSLGLAVALDLDELFFLLMILPIVLAYFLLFGMVAGWIGRATWRPGAAGLGLGLFLGWALAVTFPMFAA